MQEIAFDAQGEHVARRSVPVSEGTPESELLFDTHDHDAEDKTTKADRGAPLRLTQVEAPSSSADAPRAAAMVADAYWNVGFTEERIARAHRGTPAWVGARDEHQNRAATAKRRAGGRGESATMPTPLAVQLQG
jgi:hypothetical protein